MVVVVVVAVVVDVVAVVVDVVAVVDVVVVDVVVVVVDMVVVVVVVVDVSRRCVFRTLACSCLILPPYFFSLKVMFGHSVPSTPRRRNLEGIHNENQSRIRRGQRDVGKVTEGANCEIHRS